MRKRLLSTLLLTLAPALLAALPPVNGDTEPGWQSLFNGRDLSGWTVKCKPADRDKTWWEVRDATIVADSLQAAKHDYIWLVSDREYADFVLRLRFQAFRDSPGNTGIQIRSRYDDEAGWLDGPQVDINPPGPWRTGMVWDETRGNQRWLYPMIPKGTWVNESMAVPNIKFYFSDAQPAWNDLEIQANGTKIKAILNGTVLMEYDGAGVLNDQTHRQRRVGEKGHIALQIHTGDRLKVRYKDIRIRELRPNILFIMSDDHAAHALSCYGSQVNQTLHMDRLAAQGIRLDRCYAVNSICTPSRATILTGKYSHRNGTPVFNRFDGSQPTVSKLLQSAGYHTAMIGKWHLGSDPTGFDYWNILPGQGRYNDPIFYDREGSQVYPGYATDVIADLTLQVLSNRPPDKPFFIMSHHKAPHREWTPDEKHRRQFANRQIPEPSTLRDDYAGRTDALREQQQSVFKDLTRRDLKLVPPPGLKPAQSNQWLNAKPTEVEIEVDGKKQILTGDALDRWKYQRYMQDYLACIQSVDDNIGRVLDWLDAHGLSQNTLVIYTSDQGFFLGDHGLYDKRFMYEPSIRMPFVARWPAAMKSGTVSDALVINCDFAPTFLEMAGLSVPSDMQGRSILPLFQGSRPGDWRNAFYYRYYHDPGHHNTRAHYGIRTDTHKLIYYWTKDQWECYDLAKDPQEMRNIYPDPAAQPVIEKLKAELARLKKEVQDEDQFATALPKDGVDGPPPPRKGSQRSAQP